MLVVIGPFPPPRHGVSAVNEAVCDLARICGASVIPIDTAPTSLSRSLATRIRRLWPCAKALWRVVTTVAKHHEVTIYASMSGGLGLLSEMLLVAIGRSWGAKIVVHHNSYRYVNKDYLPMRLLIAAGGKTALHLVLSEGMKMRMRQMYPEIGRMKVLSNAAFTGRCGAPRSATKDILRRKATCLRVGYLANLSLAKGMLDTLETVKRCESEGLKVEFIVAGPFEDEGARSIFLKNSDGLKTIQWVGPVYGDAKETFFGGLDVFVFPTRYYNEAEPLVILEAMSWGIPVIAYERGCIAELLARGGVVVPQDRKFSEAATAVLASWSNDRAALDRLGASATQHYSELRASGQVEINELVCSAGKKNAMTPAL